MEFEFEGFDTELEDFEVKRTRKFDRVFRIGKGGSFIFTMMHDGIIYANSGDYYVYAIEAKTGKELWRF
ncbi:MAG: PQQ-binding-like beta-propeller repeat protein, partial [Candidatus Aenigmarchaeota archaeon]|nr:PQQ-binding-like beta-propeller repeat protein [Candidatus Aenigmarchaeota archaeon]